MAYSFWSCWISDFNNCASLVRRQFDDGIRHGFLPLQLHYFYACWVFDAALANGKDSKLHCKLRKIHQKKSVYQCPLWVHRFEVFFLNFFGTGTHSTIIYKMTSKRIEEFTEFFTYALFITIIIPLVFAVIYSFFCYYGLDLKEESFYLFYPTWFVWKIDQFNAL